MSAAKDGVSPQWLAASQRLRKVRRACLMFLDQWATSQLADQRRVDHLARQLQAAREEKIANPHNRDWSLLYRGSVLDD